MYLDARHALRIRKGSDAGSHTKVLAQIRPAPARAKEPWQVSLIEET
jgi:hypothetical protein